MFPVRRDKGDLSKSLYLRKCAGVSADGNVSDRPDSCETRGTMHFHATDHDLGDTRGMQIKVQRVGPWADEQRKQTPYRYEPRRPTAAVSARARACDRSRCRSAAVANPRSFPRTREFRTALNGEVQIGPAHSVRIIRTENPLLHV